MYQIQQLNSPLGIYIENLLKKKNRKNNIPKDGEIFKV